MRKRILEIFDFTLLRVPPVLYPENVYEDEEEILLCYVSFQIPVRFPGCQIDKVQFVNDFCVLES